MNSITLWFQGQDSINPITLHPKYHRLVAQQNSIGWRQLFNGRLSTEWARLQEDHYHVSKQKMDTTATGTSFHNSRASRYARNGTSWTSAIIVELWEQWYKVWILRNTDIHGHDQETRLKHQIEVDRQRLQTIYQNRQKLEPSIQDLLFSTVEEHQRKCSPQAIQNWLSINEAVFMQSIKNVTRRAIQGVRSIRTYFNNIQDINGRNANTPAGSSHRIRPTQLTKSKVSSSQTTIASYFATGRPPGRQPQLIPSTSADAAKTEDCSEQSADSTNQIVSPA